MWDGELLHNVYTTVATFALPSPLVEMISYDQNGVIFFTHYVTSVCRFYFSPLLHVCFVSNISHTSAPQNSLYELRIYSDTVMNIYALVMEFVSWEKCLFLTNKKRTVTYLNSICHNGWFMWLFNTAVFWTRTSAWMASNASAVCVIRKTTTFYRMSFLMYCNIRCTNNYK